MGEEGKGDDAVATLLGGHVDTRAAGDEGGDEGTVSPVDEILVSPVEETVVSSAVSPVDERAGSRGGPTPWRDAPICAEMGPG